MGKKIKKLGRFFKLVFQFILAILAIIFIFIVIVLGFIFAAFEVFFRCGRVAAVTFLRGVAEGHQEKKEAKTVMQTTMKSKRTH